MIDVGEMEIYATAYKFCVILKEFVTEYHQRCGRYPESECVIPEPRCTLPTWELVRKSLREPRELTDRLLWDAYRSGSGFLPWIAKNDRTRMESYIAMQGWLYPPLRVLNEDQERQIINDPKFNFGGIISIRATDVEPWCSSDEPLDQQPLMFSPDPDYPASLFVRFPCSKAAMAYGLPNRFTILEYKLHWIVYEFLVSRLDDRNRRDIATLRLEVQVLEREKQARKEDSA